MNKTVYEPKFRYEVQQRTEVGTTYDGTVVSETWEVQSRSDSFDEASWRADTLATKGAVVRVVDTEADE